MSIDRRTFVRTGASAVVAGSTLPLLSKPSPADAAPMPRTKLETFSANPTNVADLRDAISAMKAPALKAKDHRSWFWQSAVHAVLPAWISALPPADRPSAADQTKFWNQCPHDPSHGSAEFLLWHRAYLYYFERHLRLYKPNLSLPYWNYTNAAQRFLPSIYRSPNTAANSLYISQRTVALNNGTGQVSASAASATAAMGNPTFFGTVSANFGGFIAIGTEPGSKGLIEQRPHDTMHGAIGSPGWMGSVPTAAFDPIFWAHHTEIDHLFTQWACAPHGWGPPSSYDEWWDQPVGYFYDADGTVKNPKRRFFGLNSNLGVKYDDDACTPITPPPSSPVHVFSILNEFASARSVRLGSAKPVQLSASEPVSSAIPIPPQKVPPKGAQFAPGSPTKLVLSVGGISYSAPPSVAYDVYFGLPEGTTPDPSGPYHAGTLTFFGHGHDDSRTPQFFDVTALARAKGADLSKAAVTFVPFDLVVTKDNQPAVERRSDVTIAKIDVRQVTARP